MSVTTMTAEADGAAEEKGGRSLKKRLLILLAVLAVLAVAGWQFLLPQPAEGAPEPGEVMALEAIQINLAEGHYLRLGLALQLSADAEEIDGSRALDHAIEVFTGQQVGDLADAGHRNKIKERLSRDLAETYHGDVLEVYFTDFVTQ